MSCTSAEQRLKKDLERLQMEQPYGLSGVPRKEHMHHWDCVICGLENSLFEGGIFKLTMKFPKRYPAFPPRVRFISRIYHPNIFENGRVCLDILRDKWNPMYDVMSVLLSIQCMLDSPSVTSPANLEAAILYLGKKAEYKRRVRECVDESVQASSKPVVQDITSSQNSG